MKTQFKNKRAFTLIELLIVIAIIGILFIVLVSKVDFATDKAKATGVQTDFRSFQLAFDTVAKENAGFNTFGYNTGDNAGAIPDGYAFESTEAENKTKGDGIRNSYDQGDKNLNGKQDVNGKDGYTGTTEVFTGRKIYTETWSEVYTLVKPGTTGLDVNAVFALESAINKNLDPKLHITINASDGTITMANQARDPWKNEYHGVYISKAERDGGADRGAIIIYSNGANGKWGSAHDITNGVVSVTVPGNNTYGKDDYSIVSCYTFTNGYGEVLNMSTGFSNNQSFKGNATNTPAVVPGGNGGNAGGSGNANPETPAIPVVEPGLYQADGTYVSFDELVANNIVTYNNTVIEFVDREITGEFVVPEYVTKIDSYAFSDCYNLTKVTIGSNVTEIADGAFQVCTSLTSVVIPNNVKKIGNLAFSYCQNMETIEFGNSVETIGDHAFWGCVKLTTITLPDSLLSIDGEAFIECSGLKKVVLGDGVKTIGYQAFYNCWNIEELVIGKSLEHIGEDAFRDCYSSFEVSTNNQYFKSVDGTLYTKDGTTLVKYNGQKRDAVVTIIEGVKMIGYRAFHGATHIEKLVMPSTLLKIDTWGFAECLGLKEVVINNGLTEIGEYAFNYSPELTSIIFQGLSSDWELITLPSYWGYLGTTEVICDNTTVTFENVEPW